MGDVGDKVKSFFKSLEDKGREIISRITNQPVSSSSSAAAGDTSDSDSDSDSDDDAPKAPEGTEGRRPPSATCAPGMSNSSDKKPGFVNDDSKYTF